jgi:hypothetical protein
MDDRESTWPALPLEKWSGTHTTLHLWTQILGKIRLAQSPWVNHSWHVTLYVTARGLTTSPFPHGARELELELDLVDHQLALLCSDGGARRFPLRAEPIAAFYRRVMGALQEMKAPVKIYKRPNELPDPVLPFDLDEAPREYDPDYANRYWRVLVQADRVFKRFRAGFLGKCSPVHFFWGAPDLAVTRFSGRTAPPHPGGVPNLPDRVAREAYSHEVSSAGFWAGGGPVPHPVFYSYAYPEPPGFAAAAVEPAGAAWNTDLREFLLPYDVVRQAASPDDALLAFLRSTYEAAATLARWDRAALERPGEPVAPR